MLIHPCALPCHDGRSVVNAHLASQFALSHPCLRLGHSCLLTQIALLGADAQDVQVLTYGNERIGGLVAVTYLLAACRYLRLAKIQRRPFQCLCTLRVQSCRTHRRIAVYGHPLRILQTDGLLRL